MKSRLYILLFVILTLLTGTRCTSNGGDIGQLAGRWHLTAITIDGCIDTAYTGNVVWLFQADIIEMAAERHNQSLDEYRGTWTRTGDTLIMNFTHSDNKYPAGTGIYIPAPETHLPAAIFSLDIVMLDSRRMVLRYQSDNNNTYIYTFTRWS